MWPVCSCRVRMQRPLGLQHSLWRLAAPSWHGRAARPSWSCILQRSAKRNRCQRACRLLPQIAEECAPQSLIVQHYCLGLRNVLVQRHRLGYISPQLEITTGSLGFELAPTMTFSTFRTANMPSMTLPNTTCLLSSQSHASQVMKNLLEHTVRTRGRRAQNQKRIWTGAHTASMRKRANALAPIRPRTAVRH
jgi:hypothetical protein